MAKIARLSEPESKQKKKQMILYPIKTADERKEIKNLKDEMVLFLRIGGYE